jgi:uncharacterized protein (DUF488 family)
MTKIDVATIGFTKTTAEDFFSRLTRAGVRKIVDVRLHNSSQLAGFAKAEDLAYFLTKIGKIDYVHQPLLAPTEEILTAYRKDKRDWRGFSTRFRAVIAERKIEERFKPQDFAGACLLCAEATADHCHRQVICDYLNEKWGGRLKVAHL